MLRQFREDSGGLRRRLPFSEDDLGHPGAQRSMVVDLGETNVFEGKVAKAVHRLIGRDFSFAHFLE
jgi:hypothetical protein